MRDDGEGAYIASSTKRQSSRSLRRELPQSTVLDAENGYLSHPYPTCGAVAGWSATTAKAARWKFRRSTNFYVGNYEGVRPVIDTVTLVPELPQDMKEKLEAAKSTC